MSWLYLIGSLMGAWLTYNMFYPVRTGTRRSFFGFFVGWLWGELALHAIAFMAVASFLFIWLGALDAWPGELALLITIVSCVAVGRGYSRGAIAAPVVDKALRDGLGADYEDAVDPDLRANFEEGGVRWHPIVRPFPIRHPEVERIGDIPFHRERGVTLELDVYRHRSMPQNCPVLLQIHGGAWVIGDKKEQGLPLMNQLASKGWVCVSANYRLSPHATFPDHLIDVKRAVAWIRDKVGTYGGNPDFLVVTGGSAGGHLASMVALTPGDAEYQPGFEQADTSVDACVPIYGVYDFTDRHGLHHHKGFAEILEERIMKGSMEEIPEAYSRASPMDRIGADAPPFFVVHGELDSLVPVEEARQFVAGLRETTDSPIVYAEIPGAQHAFELFPSLRTQFVIDGVERFVTATYSRYLETRGDAGAKATALRPGAAAVVAGAALASAASPPAVAATASPSGAATAVATAKATKSAAASDAGRVARPAGKAAATARPAQRKRSTKKAEPKKAESKKAASKKADSKKSQAKSATTKKTTSKKTASKAATKKATGKKAAASKSTSTKKATAKTSRSR